MNRYALPVSLALLVLIAGSAPAADDHGVTIYPGAKKDEQWSKVQNDMAKTMGGGVGACYRTGDAVAKVAAFYQKDGFKVSVGQITADGAMLQKGDKVSMTIKFMKPLDNTSDTRICFTSK
jgi:hypothetical protein